MPEPRHCELSSLNFNLRDHAINKSSDENGCNFQRKHFKFVNLALDKVSTYFGFLNVFSNTEQYFPTSHHFYYIKTSSLLF